MSNKYTRMPIPILVQDPVAKAIFLKHTAKFDYPHTDRLLKINASVDALFNNMGGGVPIDILKGILDDLMKMDPENR